MLSTTIYPNKLATRAFFGLFVDGKYSKFKTLSLFDTRTVGRFPKWNKSDHENKILVQNNYAVGITKFLKY